MIKKEIMELVGGLSEDEEIVTSEDFDLWVKIARITDSFLFIPQSLGAYWVGDMNLSSVSEERIKRTEAVYEKYLDAIC